MTRQVLDLARATLAGLVVASACACTGADDDRTDDRTPQPTATTTSTEELCEVMTSPSASDSATTEDPAKVPSIEIESIPLLGPSNWTDLPDGRSPALPWWEYEGNQEQSSGVVLHAKGHDLPLRAGLYHRYVATWREGVVLQAEIAGVLTLHRFDGSRQKLASVDIPEEGVIEGERIAWAETSGDLTRKEWFRLSAKEPRKVRIDLPSALRLPASATRVRATAVGFLAEDLVFEVRYRCAGRKALEYRSTSGTQVDWPPVDTRDASVSADPRTGDVTARNSEGRALWSRRFTHRGSPEKAFVYESSDKMVRVEVSGETVFLSARTGRPLFRINGMIAVFEDDTHVLIEWYDGPPNPLFDPRDQFPSPSEIEWPNVLVRCSMSGECERAARVEPPANSLSVADPYW